MQHRKRQERIQNHQCKLEVHVLLEERVLSNKKYSLAEFLNILSNSFCQCIQIINVHKPSQLSKGILQFQQLLHKNLHNTKGRLWTETVAEKLGDPSHKALMSGFQLPSQLLSTAYCVWTFGHKCCLTVHLATSAGL